MASTLITTNADALKRAARDIAGRTEGLSPNSILNSMAAAIAGPGRNWGFIKGAPEGHFVQPGLSIPTQEASPWILLVDSCAAWTYATREEARRGFRDIAMFAENRDEAEKEVFASGSTTLHSSGQDDVEIILFQAKRENEDLRPAFAENASSRTYPLTRDVMERLVDLVGQRRNLLISGRPGVGKTSLLGRLSSGISADDKVVCYERSPEINLLAKNVVRVSDISLGKEEDRGKEGWDLIRVARMNPQWVIVGETTSSQMARDLLELADTGHSFITTLQANSASDGICRMADWLQSGYREHSSDEITKKIVSNQIVSVYLHKLPKGNTLGVEVTLASMSAQGELEVTPVAL